MRPLKLAYALLLALVPACTRPALHIGDSRCRSLGPDACRATAGCELAQCSACGGLVSTCYDPDVDAPPRCGATSCPVCDGLDEATCRATDGCAVSTCDACDGVPQYSGCYRPGVDPEPGCSRFGACAPPCRDLKDEASCKGMPGCVADYCSGCTDEGMFFVGCRAPNEMQSPCPLACPRRCSAFKDEASCDAQPDCHPTYHDPGTCDCGQPNCCTRFFECRDGAQVDCVGPARCSATAPYCEGAYVVAYENACYAGCVRKSDCQ